MCLELQYSRHYSYAEMSYLKKYNVFYLNICFLCFTCKIQTTKGQNTSYSHNNVILIFNIQYLISLVKNYEKDNYYSDFTDDLSLNLQLMYQICVKQKPMLLTDLLYCIQTNQPYFKIPFISLETVVIFRNHPRKCHQELPSIRLYSYVAQFL